MSSGIAVGVPMYSRGQALRQFLDSVPAYVSTAYIERGPVPFARFEFVPQAVLFRCEVFDTYTYDPAMGTSEHVDFFYGQARAGDWDWASVPSVTIHHQRDIDESYREAKRGDNHLNSDRLAEKWGLHDTAPGARSDWAQVHDRTIPEQAFEVFKRAAPPRVWLPTKRVLEGVFR